MTRPLDALQANGTFELLISQARRGSSDALGQLCEAYRPMLARRARSFLDRQLRTKVDCVDLVQEVFLQVKKGIARFQGASRGEWEAWLRQILDHQAREANSRYRQTAKRNLGLEVALGEDIARILQAPNEATSAARRDDAPGLLDAILGRLPIDYHCLIVFHCLTGCSLEIIAKATKRSIGSVQKQYGRALKHAQREALLLREEARARRGSPELPPPAIDLVSIAVDGAKASQCIPPSLRAICLARLRRKMVPVR